MSRGRLREPVRMCQRVGRKNALGGKTYHLLAVAANGELVEAVVALQAGDGDGRLARIRLDDGAGEDLVGLGIQEEVEGGLGRRTGRVSGGGRAGRGGARGSALCKGA